MSNYNIANFTAVAYTVKKCKGKTARPEDYDEYFKKIDSLGLKIEYKVSELDQYGKLHYHGILYTPRKGFFKQKLRCHGYSTQYDEIYHRDGWLRYIHKDQIEQDTEIELDDPADEIVECEEDDDHKIFTKRLV